MADFATFQQEVTGQAQMAPASNITELKQLASQGRGSADIRPHAIALPLVFGGIGAFFVVAIAFGVLKYQGPAMDAKLISTGVIFFVVGLVCVAFSAWLMFGPRKPLFTLTEEGVRVKDALLPWSSIDDYSVVQHSTNGVPTRTTVVFEHVADVTPPQLGLFFTLGSSSRKRTRLTLYTGAKGMDVDELAERIGEFRAAAHARAELARLQVANIALNPDAALKRSAG